MSMFSLGSLRSRPDSAVEGARPRRDRRVGPGALRPQAMAWLIAAASTLAVPAADVRACSRVLWADNGRAVVVGRTMDWMLPQKANLWVLPRGIERDGMVGRNSLAWSAKYGSVVVAVPITPGTESSTDGMNEKGLAAHALWLSESEYGARDEARPGLSAALWVQYYLDNFATVREAAAFTEATPYQIQTMPFDGETALIHLAMEDATGDSAIIEFAAGKARVYHDRRDTVMTNSPTYDKQLAQLGRYEGFGGDLPLPGTNEAADRFVRGAYYLKHLPTPANERETVAGILSVMRNVSQPFGAPDPARPNISPTRWRTVCDLTNRVYYFESTTSPNLVWVKLDEFDFAAGARVKKLDLVDDPDRVGDCSKQAESAEPFAWPSPGAK